MNTYGILVYKRFNVDNYFITRAGMGVKISKGKTISQLANSETRNYTGPAQRSIIYNPSVTGAVSVH